jgi:hypothetical protein
MGKGALIKVPLSVVSTNVNAGGGATIVVVQEVNRQAGCLAGCVITKLQPRFG